MGAGSWSLLRAARSARRRCAFRLHGKETDQSREPGCMYQANRDGAFMRVYARLTRPNPLTDNNRSAPRQDIRRTFDRVLQCTHTQWHSLNVAPDITLYQGAWWKSISRHPSNAERIDTPAGNLEKKGPSIHPTVFRDREGSGEGPALRSYAFERTQLTEGCLN